MLAFLAAVVCAAAPADEPAAQPGPGSARPGGQAVAPLSGVAPLFGSAVAPLLKKLGVVLNVTERPAWPRPGTNRIVVVLAPQAQSKEPVLVSFGVPFPPATLEDDKLICVTDETGAEIPVFTKPLVYWWIDGKKDAIRSALVQFEMAFPQKYLERVTLAWDKPRRMSREKEMPAEAAQTVQTDEGFEFHCPKALALLPEEWLCASLVAWQQVPAKENLDAKWFDEHLLQQFPGSLRNIASKSVEAHLFDRPATYAKIYVRYSDDKYLLAALRACDFYIAHLEPNGEFDLRKGQPMYASAEGPAILYMLTGDERYREAALRVLKAWANTPAIAYNGKGEWTERLAGIGMNNFLQGYELSGDARLLETARRYFDGVFTMQTRPLDGKEPDGAWVHTAESHGDGNGWTTSPWMSALLTDSIWKLWMITGEPRCPASLAMYAKFIEKYAVTQDGKGVYYMANSPGRGTSDEAESPPHNMEACYILAMGYYLSGGADRGLLEKINTLWPPLMGDGANQPGRKFNWRFRETSMLVWFLQNTPEASKRP